MIWYLIIYMSHQHLVTQHTTFQELLKKDDPIAIECMLRRGYRAPDSVYQHIFSQSSTNDADWNRLRNFMKQNLANVSFNRGSGTSEPLSEDASMFERLHRPNAPTYKISVLTKNGIRSTVQKEPVVTEVTDDSVTWEEEL
jgi:hypothetical protein